MVKFVHQNDVFDKMETPYAVQNTFIVFLEVAVNHNWCGHLKHPLPFHARILDFIVCSLAIMSIFCIVSFPYIA